MNFLYTFSFLMSMCHRSVVSPVETTGWQIGRAVPREAVRGIALAAVILLNSLLPQMDVCNVL
jgi:hypothetical protein